MKLTKNMALLATMTALILLPSCARQELKREMKRFMASEIVLPAEMEKSQGGTFVPVRREELSGPKMIVFIDSTECSSCRLSKLMVYDSVERLSREGGNFRFVVLISAKKSESAKVRDLLLHSEISFPVYLDTEHDFRRLNPSIPDDVRFHSFFLDGSGHPVFIGNPAGSARMMSLLEKRASMEEPETVAEAGGEIFVLRKYCLDVARIGAPEAEEVLAHAGTGSAVSGLVVFVPPYVCGECLSQEVEVLKSLRPGHFLVLAPESRADALCREFSEMSAVEVLSYPESSVVGCDAASFDGVIYFLVSDSHVKDVYLANREAPEASEVFVSRCEDQIRGL